MSFALFRSKKLIPAAKFTPATLGKFKQALKNEVSSGRFEEVWVKLNEGCSNNCPFCYLKAPKGVRNPMPDELVESIAECVGDLPLGVRDNFTIHPHDNTDPLDRKDIVSICDIFSRSAKVSFSTAVPVGSEQLFLDVISALSSHPENRIRLSLSPWNEKRLMRNPKIADVVNSCGIEKFQVASFFVVLDNIIRIFDENEFVRLAVAKAKSLGLSGSISKFLKDSFYCKEARIPLPIFPIIGTTSAAFFFACETDQSELSHFSNLISFSRAVNSGALREGTPFLLEYWNNDGRDYSNDAGLKVITRGWNFSLRGKLFGPKFYEKHMFEAKSLVVGSNGEISVVFPTTLSEENKSGLIVDKKFEF